jgi:hydroxymethylglutaryl-CoA synthase
MAAGFEQGLDENSLSAGEEVLTLGYGSGDAAEVIPFFMADRWREAAAAIGFADVMQFAVDLNEEQYIALHDGRHAHGLEYIPRNEFIIDRVGESNERHFSDLGIEYYRYAG